MTTEEAIKLIQRYCRENHKEIDARLTKGSTVFSNHEARIISLETKHDRLMVVNALLMANGG